MSLKRQLSNIIRTVKNAGYEDVEVLVREATSNDAAGAPDALVWQVINASCKGSNPFALAASMLWKRIGDREHPRHVYKGLTLLFHLIQHGSYKEEWRINALHHVDELRDLQRDSYFKENGTIINSIRRAAQTLEELVVHPEKIDLLKRLHQQRKEQAREGQKKSAVDGKHKKKSQEGSEFGRADDEADFEAAAKH